MVHHFKLLSPWGAEICVTATNSENPQFFSQRGFCAEDEIPGDSNENPAIPVETEPPTASQEPIPSESASPIPTSPASTPPAPTSPTSTEQPVNPNAPDADGYVWDTTQIMKTTWDTSISASCETINLPISDRSGGMTVDWGDGKGPQSAPDTITTALQSPVYGKAGPKTITIQGKFGTWGGSSTWTDAGCLTSVDQWGDTGTTNLKYAFERANALTKVQAIPKTTTDLSNAFSYTSSNPDISGIRTPNVTTMYRMFIAASTFNRPVDKFNTANVVQFDGMFQTASKFNQPVNFVTSNALSMDYMFYKASSFNQPINFDTKKVTDMQNMFDTAVLFNQPVVFTDTSSVIRMDYMFKGASKFDQPLNFDVSNVTRMSSMFQSASAFNQDLSQWKPVKLTPANRTDFSTGATLWVKPKPTWTI